MYLGLDIGTSAVKAVITDSDGRVVGQASAPLAVSRPHPNWAEQDPEDWWAACGAAVVDLPADLRARVIAIGLSGQMHGAVLLDAAHAVLRPAILWNDTRSAPQCAAMEADFPQMRVITGNQAMPGFTAPKLLWLKAHEPEIFAKIDLVLLPKDYVRLRMTGIAASDMSDASGTMWLDVGARAWSEDMLRVCGLAVSHMPKLVEGNQTAGALLGEVAQAWGLGSVPVAGGGGDQAAGAIGAGVIHAGDGLISLGTSGVVFLATDHFHANPQSGVHAFCHALPDTWHVMSVMLSAGVCLDWVSRLCGFEDVSAALRAAEAKLDRKGIPLFLPYLGGERTPHNNPAARGVFFGLDHDSDGAALVMGVLEGVALGLRDGFDAMLAAGAQRPAQLYLIGGGARSSLWAQILADTLNVDIVLSDDGAVGPALGAARLAQVAMDGGPIEQVCAKPAIVATFVPRPDHVAQANARFVRFQALYRALMPHFTQDETPS
jgi:xylulokinase